VLYVADGSSHIERRISRSLAESSSTSSSASPEPRPQPSCFPAHDRTPKQSDRARYSRRNHECSGIPSTCGSFRRYRLAVVSYPPYDQRRGISCGASPDTTCRPSVGCRAVPCLRRTRRWSEFVCTGNIVWSCPQTSEHHGLSQVMSDRQSAALPAELRPLAFVYVRGHQPHEIHRSSPLSWARRESNPRLPPCKGGTLTAELRALDGPGWTRTSDLLCVGQTLFL
jgi:hypothetical protein